MFLKHKHVFKKSQLDYRDEICDKVNLSIRQSCTKD